MKTFTKYLLLPLCCLFMAAGCGKDDLPTGEQPEGPGSETGILSFENWDLTVADDMEILPTDNAPGTSSTRKHGGRTGRLYRKDLQFEKRTGRQLHLC